MWKLMKSFTMISIRLSEHNPAVERGHHRQTWLPWEKRLCTHCTQWRWKRTTLFNHLSTVCNTWERNIHRLKPPKKTFKARLKTKQLPYHSSKGWELLWLENRIQLECSQHEDCLFLHWLFSLCWSVHTRGARYLPDQYGEVFYA